MRNILKELVAEKSVTFPISLTFMSNYVVRKRVETNRCPSNFKTVANGLGQQGRALP